MENHTSATSGAVKPKMAEQSALNWKNVAAIATATLGVFMGEAYANGMPQPASAPRATLTINNPATLQTQMESLLPQDFMARYYAPVISENKELLLFYYEGLATNITDKALLTTRTQELVCFLRAYGHNNVAADDLLKLVEKAKKGEPIATQGFDPVGTFVKNLSPIFSGRYATEFATLSQNAEDIYAKGKALQGFIRNKNTDALALAEQNLRESQRVRDESRQRLTATRVELTAKKREATQTGEARQQTAQVRRMFGQ